MHSSWFLAYNFSSEHIGFIWTEKFQLVNNSIAKEFIRETFQSLAARSNKI